ncbi:CDC45-like protein [Artomyces pyxidatus]|uniref:CDC45-like protein n=1 Tax=Artomyces pyxidatus TaxID=48021 RepID=A0ACB8TBQ6_9AGAM|nr:CDC45-like protein [Artomyces pyxidatus]
MVFLPPPHLASATRPSYAEAYSNILAAHRRSPLTSASSVIILVAPDVDALCAAKMLAELLKQDDVMHRIVPLSGIADLERMRDELMTYAELHTLILLNIGAILDLPSAEWFGDFSPQLRVHIIDSSRPQNLSSLFAGGEGGERVLIWDDGGAEDLEEERKAWETLAYEPEPDSDEDSEEEDLPEDQEEDDEYEAGSASGKRRSLGEGRSPGKRRRLDADRPPRISREQRDQYHARLDKHYLSGTWFGQSAAGTVYILATVLERVDNNLLWLAILGLTYQYMRCLISREEYDKYHSIYYDEVFRLNPPPPANDTQGLASLGPDDNSLRATDELRFALFRHWTLYDAMFHSSYVGSKMGIWKEQGRKRLTGLLAKMGYVVPFSKINQRLTLLDSFSIPQTQQPYSHMDMDLKRQLRTKLDIIAPEYGMVELSYPSFVRCYGYHTQPLSAADAVEALNALLDAATGVRMEVEVEGARNGGEWFGGGRVWRASGKWGAREVKEQQDEGHDEDANAEGRREEVDTEAEGKDRDSWLVRNFWNAFDALEDIMRLREALGLAMSVQKAIIRTGSSIIDKNDIRMTKGHRVVQLKQGPDLALFTHPGVLYRLGLWLADALRDRVSGANVGRRTKKKSLPLILACWNERARTYIVIGMNAALDFGDVKKNEFGLAFLDAKEDSGARTRHSSFDTSILEVNEADFDKFIVEVYRTKEKY